MNTSSTQLFLPTFATSLWSAGFCPIYLLGTDYRLLLMLSWLRRLLRHVGPRLSLAPIGTLTR